MKYLFQPIKIGNLELKNRIVMPPMHHFYTPDGYVNQRLINYYAIRAAGGVGLIVVGGCSIDKLGLMPMMISLQDDKFIPGLQDLTAAVHKAGAKISAQLYHTGRYSISALIGQQPIAPSPIASTFTREVPREMTPKDITDVKESFAAAAKRAKEAGFDAVEITASAGNLICQFLSPITNHRTDEYGGSWENRCRFGVEVVKSIKESTGKGFPLFVRIAGNDFMPGGNTNIQAADFAKELEKAGVDCIDVTGGWHETVVPQITYEVPPAGFAYLAAGIKAAVSIPVIASNRINDPKLAEEILGLGMADLINMGRPLIADPELPRKAMEGRVREIRKCIACNQACMDRAGKMKDVRCTVNGFSGREHELAIKPSEHQKKVLVVGGGPAGMEIAAIAAERGHAVILWEEREELGGQVQYSAKVRGKENFISLIEFQKHRMELAGVKVVLGKKATKKEIVENNFDAVVIATGSQPNKVSWSDNKGAVSVVSAIDILQGKHFAGKRVVVVGGGTTGCETAIYLAEQGTISADILRFLMIHQAEDYKTLMGLLNSSPRQVTVLEMQKGLGCDFGITTRWGVIKNMKRLGIETLEEAKVVAITADGIRVESKDAVIEIPADTVVLATGNEPNNHLYEELQGGVKELYIIGDAQKPRNLTEAIAEATQLGIKL